MSTSSYDSVFGVTTSQVVVPVGITVAVLLAGDQGANINSTVLKYFSGGTLFIVGAPFFGGTLSAAQLNTALSSAYIMGTTEVMSFNGPVRLYLGAGGATTRVMVIQGLR